jgi:nitrite reductase/ring-hydroxylating ferredoxin subunit
MYISADEPRRSVRSTPAGDGRRVVLVGGEGGRPGDDGAERYARLERFLQERFGAAAEYRWSTHDYVPLDGLPYIGRLLPGDGRVLVATGFAKWGMTKGTLAAALLADAVLGRPNVDAELYSATRVDAKRSVPSFATENGRVGLAFVRDRFRPRIGRAAVDALAPGEGAVCRIGAKLYAVHRDDDGRLHSLSARCPHLGCIVGWNGADRAWECPCHGSRFAADGSLVQGPATADLRAEPLG